MCENLFQLPKRLQRFSDSRPRPAGSTKEITMRASTISADTAAQATIVNRFAGSVRAWTFLVHQGYDYRQVFEFLAALDGPEGVQSAANSPKFQLIYFEGRRRLRRRRRADEVKQHGDIPAEGLDHEL